MILCGEQNGIVELLQPSSQDQAGDKIFLHEDLQSDINEKTVQDKKNVAESNESTDVVILNMKKWKKLASDFYTDSEGIPTFSGKPLRTVNNVLPSLSIKNAIIR